jgi:rRNA maturation protein Rpf1
MIKHVVCYKLKDNSIEKKEEVKAMLLSMVGKVSYFTDIKVGLDFLQSERSYDVVLEMTFNTKEDMEKYQKDEYHTNVVKTLMHKIRSASVAVDYEIE